jgi:hypothetical protein
MYSKRKTYSKPYRRTTAPKSYRNGFVKTAKSLTAYLQGHKLILIDAVENSVGMWICSFKATKNSVIVKKMNGIYNPIQKTLEVKMGSKRYFLTAFKK